MTIGRSSGLYIKLWQSVMFLLLKVSRVTGIFLECIAISIFMHLLKNRVKESECIYNNII